MNEQEFNDKLDATAATLPRAIQPARDLWPGIEARLDEIGAGDVNAATGTRFMPFVAGVAATALVALLALQISERAPAPADQPLAQTVPDAAAPFADTGVLVVEPRWLPDVTRTRNDLQADYAASLEGLEPETRAIVEENLAQIHRSLAQIHEALAQDPSNAALHRLLAGTYQRELNLFSSIGALNRADTQL